jgi:hypothetical protein
MNVAGSITCTAVSVDWAAASVAVNTSETAITSRFISNTSCGKRCSTMRQDRDEAAIINIGAGAAGHA